MKLTHPCAKIVKKSQAGGGVAVKIEHAVYQSSKMFGRHFDEKDELYSHITRASIDVLKVSFVCSAPGIMVELTALSVVIQDRRLERGVAAHQGTEARTYLSQPRPPQPFSDSVPSD